MWKKYTISQTQKELDKNFKYITKKYKKNRKFIKKRDGKWKLDVNRDFFSKFNHKLCELYIDEIELFYLVNNFSKRELQMHKCNIQRKYEKKSTIFMPIILSIISTLYYGGLQNMIWKPFLRVVDVYKSTLKDVADQVSAYDIVWNSKTVLTALFFLGELILIGIFICAIFFTPLITAFWLLIKLIASILDGLNFNKVVARQYELDFLTRVIASENYCELIEKLDKYATCYFGVINQLAFNFVVKNKSGSIDSIEEKISEYILKQEIMNDMFDDSFLNICEKEIIIKSIIYRSLLKINDGSSILRLKKNKLIIRIC